VRIKFALLFAIAFLLPISVQAGNKAGGGPKPPTVKPANTKSAADPKPKPFIKLEGVKGESKDATHKDE
jgi:hypothetical protein